MLTQLSLEERLERFEDAFLDVLADPAERLSYMGRFGTWPASAERHAEAEDGILVVVTCVPEGEPEAVGRRL
jgi:hypothetical protein